MACVDNHGNDADKPGWIAICWFMVKLVEPVTDASNSRWATMNDFLLLSKTLLGSDERCPTAYALAALTILLSVGPTVLRLFFAGPGFLAATARGLPATALISLRRALFLRELPPLVLPLLSM